VNFNVYLDDDTGARLDRVAKSHRKSRNALIREAVGDFIARNERGAWPPLVADFRGLSSARGFERHRDQLDAPAADPLA